MHATFLRFCLVCLCSCAVAGRNLLTAGEAEAPDLPLEEPARPAQTAGSEQRLISMGEALASANAELGALREQQAQLKLQMEALGVAAVKGDNRSIQTRLLAASSELRASEKLRVELVDRNNKLAEAAAACLARPHDDSARKALELVLKTGAGIARSGTATAVTLDAARVVSCKYELGLAVINAGRDSGVRTGAPLQIVRSSKTIATGIVIDVRDRIAGIFITSPNPATVRIGDAVKPELMQSIPTK